MARGDKNKPAHSEHVAETASERQKEERERERGREKPKPESDGVKPTELRTTSRSELDKRIDEKEGPQALRTKEEMSLHEEISRTADDDDAKDD